MIRGWTVQRSATTSTNSSISVVSTTDRKEDSRSLFKRSARSHFFRSKKNSSALGVQPLGLLNLGSVSSIRSGAELIRWFGCWMWRASGVEKRFVLVLNLLWLSGMALLSCLLYAPGQGGFAQPQLFNFFSFSFIELLSLFGSHFPSLRPFLTQHGPNIPSRKSLIRSSSPR